MSTAITMTLSPALQALIDLRLDTIDRLLLNYLPRRDRTNIVSEVETQIFELLGETAHEEPTRDDVLAVLSRLDPPEAYLPENTDAREPSAASRVRSHRTSRAAEASRQAGRSAKAGTILGLVSLSFILIAPIIYLLAMVLNSEEVLILGLLLAAGCMLVTGVLGIIFSVCSGWRPLWSPTGLSTSVVALLVWLCGGLLLVVGGL